MKFKSLFLSIIAIVAIFFVSEGVNYLSQTASRSSVFLNKFFIRRAILSAKNRDFNASMFYLLSASRINIFGEYDPYRNLMPNDYTAKIVFPSDSRLEASSIDYISSVKDADLIVPEDQGLGLIFYNLALTSYDSGYNTLSSDFLKLAMYNNPEFAPFHAELVNYYFSVGDISNMDSELDYCSKFEGSKKLCETYKNNDLLTGRARKIGFLQDVVENYYLNY